MSEPRHGLPTRRSELHTVRRLAVVACCAVSLACGTGGADAPIALAPAMPEIVARSIEEHGGDLFERSTVRYDLCSKSGCVDVTVRRDGGLYHHEVEGTIGGERLRIVDTNDPGSSHSVRVWALDGDEPVEGPIERPIPADDTQRWRDAATARIYHAFLPFRLADPSVRFDDRGLEDWGDRRLHRVAVGFESGTSSSADDVWAFWFDPETARLVQFAYSYRGEPDGLRFRRLRNVRRVEGLLFADQENLGWEGPGLTVPALSPETVEELRHVSDVALRNVEVEILR